MSRLPSLSARALAAAAMLIVLAWPAMAARRTPPPLPVKVMLQQEFDSREAPADWHGGYVGIGAADPATKPKLDYVSILFRGMS